MKVRDIENVVFDIDATLITHKARNANSVTVYKRPYIEDLLDHLFANYKNVAIWTHASNFWAKLILKNVLKPRPWAFIHTVDDAEYQTITPSQQDCKDYGLCSTSKMMLKNLNKVWNSPKFVAKGFTPKNTVIVDDNTENSALNRDNEIICPAYEVPSGDKDHDAFALALIVFFDKNRYGDLNTKDIAKFYKLWLKQRDGKI